MRTCQLKLLFKGPDRPFGKRKQYWTSTTSIKSRRLWEPDRKQNVHPQEQLLKQTCFTAIKFQSQTRHAVPVAGVNSDVFCYNCRFKSIVLGHLAVYIPGKYLQRNKTNVDVTKNFGKRKFIWSRNSHTTLRPVWPERWEIKSQPKLQWCTLMDRLPRDLRTPWSINKLKRGIDVTAVRSDS